MVCPSAFIEFVYLATSALNWSEVKPWLLIEIARGMGVSVGGSGVAVGGIGVALANIVGRLVVPAEQAVRASNNSKSVRFIVNIATIIPDA